MRCGSHDPREHVEPRVGHVHAADVRILGGERIVGGEHAGRRQRVEQRGLADVRQSDDSEFQHDMKFVAAVTAVQSACSSRRCRRSPVKRFITGMMPSVDPQLERLRERRQQLANDVRLVLAEFVEHEVAQIAAAARIVRCNADAQPRVVLRLDARPRCS